MAVTAEFIRSQSRLLQEQVSSAAEDATAFFNSIICSQHESTSRQIRLELLSQPPRLCQDLRAELTKYCRLIEELKLPNVILMEQTADEERKSHRRRLSVDLHSLEGIDEDIESIDEHINKENDENLSQLRRRLMDSRTKSVSAASGNSVPTFDEQLHEEERRQEDILETMIGAVQDIRNAAKMFQQKLHEDQDVMKTAEKGLSLTSNKLKKTSVNLARTIEQLGWRQLLYIAASCLLAFIISLLLIMIFPKF